MSPRDTSVYIQPGDEDDGDDSCAANSWPFIIINDDVDVSVDIDVGDDAGVWFDIFKLKSIQWFKAGF